MNLELAIHLTEILLGIAFIQQSIEHLQGPKDEQSLFLPRIFLSILLIFGLGTKWICLALLINAILTLRRFQGIYNGGSDRMGLLTLCCLCLVHFIPFLRVQEYIFGYLALQVILSYFIAGWVKIINPEWRSGQALQDLFRFSVYPASERMRKLADHHKMLFVMSWVAILFELSFPFMLITQETLVIGLVLAAGFHLANTFLLGFNRFFWVWLAAYPSVIWFQWWIFG